ncbi:MAG: hypothetical protein ISQ08_10810 [Planctomycetes bacterium]|nr:hypothetical protein [Planctomycetota bacterium]
MHPDEALEAIQRGDRIYRQSQGRFLAAVLQEAWSSQDESWEEIDADDDACERMRELRDHERSIALSLLQGLWSAATGVGDSPAEKLRDFIPRVGSGMCSVLESPEVQAAGSLVEDPVEALMIGVQMVRQGRHEPLATLAQLEAEFGTSKSTIQRMPLLQAVVSKLRAQERQAP